MSYFLPIRFLKVGPEMAIPLHRISMIGASTESTLKKFAKTESKKKALIRASGSGKLPTKSFIILDNGTFIASPYTVNALIKKVSEMQAADLGDSSLIVRSKVKLRADEIDQIEQNEFEDEFGNINIDDVISKIKESGDFDADEEDAEQYAEGEDEFNEDEEPEDAERYEEDTEA